MRLAGADTLDKDRAVGTFEFSGLNSVIQLVPEKYPRMETIEIAVKIPAEYSSKSYGIAKNLGDIKRDEWAADGSRSQ